MATTITINEAFDQMILKSMQEYIRGRAEAIVEKHKEQAAQELDEAVRDEISRAVLSLGKYVNFQRLDHQIVITIEDRRTQ